MKTPNPTGPQALMGMDRKITKKPGPSRKLVLFASGGAFVLVLAYLFFFQFRGSSLNVEKDRVTVSTVEKGPFLEYIPITGAVMPISRNSLATSEGGRVEKIFMEAGTMVEKGTPILQLVNTDLLLNIMWRDADFVAQTNQLRQLRLSLEQYQQALRQQMNTIENELAKAKSAFERNRKLYADQLLSEFEFEKFKLDYEYQVRNRDIVAESQKKEMQSRTEQLGSLEEQLKRMEANLAASKQKLEALVIRAPISGQLSALTAEIGQYKAPGTEIGQIDVLTAFSVRAPIDEFYITRVVAGQKAEFELGAKTYELVIRWVFPEVRDGRFEVDFDFVGDAPPGIRRGQTLHVRLELGDVAEAVLVAKGGFYQTTGGNWVYALEPGGDFAVKRPIKIGRQNPDVYEILEGLQPGDRVITSSYEGFGDMARLILK
ncbi:MAG TPA: HlyD family efflux transporter periplasmic adaptor subunit [Candidatus Aminicenantes bacterium]|nr:HlyD family efflux transporter periplasmic adaptor subunit [Candidatus Aminicenantes bacterium]HRY65166.1 HlyD family efflux transporter periplasmic adaptor subunit [Candidatus Aminicenantes bacterium]HRZ72366.1 HlyD family efflux transporter periplasmic adaptor subunit [Candidatus Aminicenantes bacterium]